MIDIVGHLLDEGRVVPNYLVVLDRLKPLHVLIVIGFLFLLELLKLQVGLLKVFDIFLDLFLLLLCDINIVFCLELLLNFELVRLHH